MNIGLFTSMYPVYPEADSRNLGKNINPMIANNFPGSIIRCILNNFLQHWIVYKYFRDLQVFFRRKYNMMYIERVYATQGHLQVLPRCSEAYFKTQEKDFNSMIANPYDASNFKTFRWEYNTMHTE